MIIDGYKGLAMMAIKDGAKSEADAREYIYKLNPSFKTDQIFQDTFGPVYGIAACEMNKAIARVTTSSYQAPVSNDTGVVLVCVIVDGKPVVQKCTTK
jgi:hypothetical protein